MKKWPFFERMKLSVFYEDFFVWRYILKYAIKWWRLNYFKRNRIVALFEIRINDLACVVLWVWWNISFFPLSIRKAYWQKSADQVSSYLYMIHYVCGIVYHLYIIRKHIFCAARGPFRSFPSLFHSQPFIIHIFLIIYSPPQQRSKVRVTLYARIEFLFRENKNTENRDDKKKKKKNCSFEKVNTEEPQKGDGTGEDRK